MTRFSRLSLSASLALVACGGDDKGGSGGGTAGGAGSAGTAGAAGGAGALTIPEPVVNEQKEFDAPVIDSPYIEERATLFRTTDALGDLDVRALALVATRVYAGTATGLFVLAAGDTKFTPVALGAAGGVVDLAPRGLDLLVARADGVDVIDAAGVLAESWPVSAGPAQAIVASANGAYVGLSPGVVEVTASGETALVAAAALTVTDLAVAGTDLFVATATGLFRIDTVAGTSEELAAPSLIPDKDVRALRAGGGRLAVATSTGLALLDTTASASEIVLPGPLALPTDALTAVDLAGTTTLVGHEIGASVLADGHVDHYLTERYTPDARITAVALAANGARWLGTAKGVSRIDLVETKLAAKAESLEALNPMHLRMDGFVSDSVRRADAWDPASAVSLGDNDNDGLWTEMQIGAWCFAYASTGDERFYDAARKSMDVMQLQFDVPAATFEAAGKKPGFITRSLVRSDEGALFEGKKTEPNWHLQEYGGKTYYWKDDTSSDEYAGHYFGIPLFHDLCAKTDEERAEIATRLGNATRYVIENDYLLIDLDGEPTDHGDWHGLANAVDGIGPCLAERLEECGESVGGGGWLNSMEILGMLLSTWKITGDDFFYEEYERIATEERYYEMVPLTELTATVTTRTVGNHSDHELASLAYFTLLRYEPNVDRRAIVVQSILDFYGYERLERNSLELGVIASSHAGVEVDRAVRTLREQPIDRRMFVTDNSHRRDYIIDAQRDRFDEQQFTDVPPYDEIFTIEWNTNPYAVTGGHGAEINLAPWPWLLPYWMLRYYGALGG